jgi:hypothetical protein
MPEKPELQWFAPEQNPWRVRLLDVRPVTQAMISTSSDPQCAANALSYGRDDGRSFIGAPPIVPRTVQTILRYRRPALLADGALFRPAMMEHKWALFYLQRRIVCVRSWQRQVFVMAETVDAGEFLEVVRLHGAFDEEQEPQDFTVRFFDFLMRSHALGLEWPAPLPAGDEQDDWRAALWCFSCFGNMATCATPDAIPFSIPEEVLRTS